MVEGFLLTINREICFLIKVGVSSLATPEKILRYVSRCIIVIVLKHFYKTIEPFYIVRQASAQASFSSTIKFCFVLLKTL